MFLEENIWREKEKYPGFSLPYTFGSPWGLSLTDSLPGNGTAKEPGKCSSLRHKCTLSRGIMVAGTPGGSMWPVGQARQQPPEKESVPLAHCSGGP